MIVTLILPGRKLGARAKTQTGEEIRTSVGLRRKTARVLRDGKNEDIAVGDIVPGESYAADGFRPGQLDG